MTVTLKGNIHHSVCRWCYDQIPLQQFCEAVAAMGIESIDLLDDRAVKTFTIDLAREIASRDLALLSEIKSYVRTMQRALEALIKIPSKCR